MTVAAGVVGDLPMPTLGTLQDMTAESRGAADGHIPEGAALLSGELGTVLFQELVDTAPDDLGHGGPRSSHER